jgi:hypothetical protein
VIKNFTLIGLRRLTISETVEKQPKSLVFMDFGLSGPGATHRKLKISGPAYSNKYSHLRAEKWGGPSGPSEIAKSAYMGDFCL